VAEDVMERMRMRMSLLRGIHPDFIEIHHGQYLDIARSGKQIDKPILCSTSQLPIRM
jgi:hypothetical protein